MEIIHIVLGKANPNRMNGVNKVVYHMAVKQTEIGLKVAVWGITADLTVNYDERNFETQLFLKSKNPFGLSPDLKKAILAKKGKAIFHLHGGWIPVFYSVSEFLNNTQQPFVFTPHGAYNTIAMERNLWVKKIYFHFFEKKILNYTEKIHSIGKSEVAALNLFYPNKKAVLLPYGYESTVKIDSFVSNNNAIVFGFIGRLDIHTKGLDTLLKAFAEFNLFSPEAKLWIVGDSTEKSKLEYFIQELNLSQNVTLFGSKFGEEKNRILQQMDVFVHPSRNEGLPTAVIEAASYGKPCIVTEATNIGEIIEKYNAGKTIHGQSAKQLCEAFKIMQSIWGSNSEYETMCKNAVQMVKETYNWDKVITDLNQKLYQIQ